MHFNELVELLRQVEFLVADLDANDAADILQDAFIELVNRLERGQAIEYIRTHIRWILASVRANWFRKNRRGIRRGMAPLTPAVTEAGPTCDPETIDFDEAFSLGLTKMPPRMRTVVIEVVVKGRTRVEVAAALDLNRECVSKLLRKAAAILLPLLGQMNPRIAPK